MIPLKENIRKTKSFDIDVRIIKPHKYLKKEHGEYVLSQ